VKYTINIPLMSVAKMIPWHVFRQFIFTKRKKGARLNSVAIFNQGLKVPVTNPVFKKVRKDICSNLNTWMPNKMIIGAKVPIKKPSSLLFLLIVIN